MAGTFRDAVNTNMAVLAGLKAECPEEVTPEEYLQLSRNLVLADWWAFGITDTPEGEKVKVLYRGQTSEGRKVRTVMLKDPETTC